MNRKRPTRKPNVVADQMAAFFNLPPPPEAVPELASEETEATPATETNVIDPLPEPEPQQPHEQQPEQQSEQVLEQAPEQVLEQPKRIKYYSRTLANKRMDYYSDGSIEVVLLK